MIYPKSMLFYMKIYNNIKGKPPEQVAELLDQLAPEARVKIESMLRKFNKKGSAATVV